MLAAQISDTLTGRTVTDAITNATPHKFAFFHGNPGGYVFLLGGRTLEKAKAVGGMGLVRREAYLGGHIYYCPECQSLE